MSVCGCLCAHSLSLSLSFLLQSLRSVSFSFRTCIRCILLAQRKHAHAESFVSILNCREDKALSSSIARCCSRSDWPAFAVSAHVKELQLHTNTLTAHASYAFSSLSHTQQFVSINSATIEATLKCGRSNSCYRQCFFVGFSFSWPFVARFGQWFQAA